MGNACEWVRELRVEDVPCGTCGREMARRGILDGVKPRSNSIGVGPTGATGPQGPSGGAALSVLSGQLTDAQIRALPTIPHILVPAPGPGLAIVPDRLALLLDAAAGAYTGIDANSSLFATQNGVSWLQSIVNGNGTGQVQVTGLLGAGDKRLATLAPDSFFSDAWGGSLPTVIPAADLTGVENHPLVLSAANGADFTGGNAANTLSWRVWYHIVPTVPFSTS